MNRVPFNEDVSAALVSQNRKADDYCTLDWKRHGRKRFTTSNRADERWTERSPMVEYQTTITIGIVYLPITRPSYRIQYCAFVT